MITPSTLSEQLLFSTVRIEAESKIGTGFFFEFKVDDQFLRLIITNKHVVDGVSECKFYCHEATVNGNSVSPSGNSFPIRIKDFNKYWKGHPNPEIDLCGIPVQPINELAEKNGKEIYSYYIKDDKILPDSQLEELTAAEEILMIGYPEGLWDHFNNMPVTRRGITASHPALDFQGSSNGIVDIACFCGSSGSPIVIANEGIHSVRGGVSGARRSHLLGVISHSFQVEEEGDFKIVEVPTQKQPIPVFQMNINIGLYIKAKEILSLCQHIVETET